MELLKRKREILTQKDQEKFQNVLDKVVISSRDHISKEVSTQRAAHRSELIAQKVQLKLTARESLKAQIEGEERERLIRLYTEGYSDHSLKSGLYTIAEKKLIKEKESVDKILNFQVEFFRKRRIAFTKDKADLFLRILSRFSKAIVLWTINSSEQKLKFFTRWYIKTFGLKNEMRNLMTRLNRVQLEKVGGKTAVMQQLFSFKNLSRFNKRIYEAFHKWRLMVKLGYPLYKRNKHRFMSVIPYKVHDNYLNNLKQTGIVNLIEDYVHNIHKRTGFKSSILQQMDIPTFYSKLTTGVHAISKAVHRKLDLIFLWNDIKNFPYENSNIQKLKKKHLTYKQRDKDYRPPISQLVPHILAQQVFIFSYKRALISAFKKLQSQVKIDEMENKLKEINNQVRTFRMQARMELFIKLFTKMYMRLSSMAFSKWRFQTKIRKVMYTKEHKLADDLKMAGEREMYRKIKGIVETLAQKYVVSMSQTVVRNVKSDPELINKLINDDFDRLIEETLNNF